MPRELDVYTGQLTVLSSFYSKFRWGGVVTCGNVSQLLDEHKIFYWTKLVLLQDQTVKGMAGKSMPQTAFISQMLC